ncbi:MAG: alginate export family protein [Cytophagales bacterium]|nr:alginate export family protein [Cytophagales bacterium]
MKRNFTIKVICFSFLCLLISLAPSLAQKIKIDAQIRPRAELRHGVKTLVNEEQPAVFGVTQRSRINFWYHSDKIKIGLSVQDVRTWGDTQQAVLNDGAKTTIAQAWAQVFFHENFSLKLGRQPISYDDERIFGALDWANQGRFHDAGVFRYAKGNLTLDAGAAFNQKDGNFGLPTNNGIIDNYYTTANYKYMQYVWLHEDWEGLKLSLLFLNTGYQAVKANGTIPTDTTTAFTQTYGAYLDKKFGDLDVNGSFYIQSGHDRVVENGLWVRRRVNAYLWAIWLKYNFSDRFNVYLGSDYLSGTNLNDNETKNKSFNPSFGTNHKFYGLMDYFYAGSAHRNVGLWDAHLGLGYKFSAKFKMNLIYHNYTSAAKLYRAVGGDKEDRDLGSEFDLTFVYKPAKAVTVVGGYSQMFASKAMELLKGGDSDVSQNWAWLQININPTIFMWTKKKEEQQ